MISDRANRAPILLAEDEPNDVLFMQVAFKKANLANPLMPVPDGEAAIAYLAGTGQYCDRELFPLPCLILTDLKMPCMDGFELLRWLKQYSEFRHIPAIVLSSSDEPADRQQAAEYGAADYWVKPAEIERLMSLIREMRDAWVAAHCS
jgi:CheY-like chemotaxis protein